MTNYRPVIVPDIIGAVVANMTVPGISYINYQFGREIQIVKSLADLDDSLTMKGKKYPLIAMVIPVVEDMTTTEFYSICRIERIVLATLSKQTDDTPTRYEEGGTFKSILYPMYYEFFNRLAQSPNVIGVDVDSFSHIKMDNPGQQPVSEQMTDFVDSIEILGLEITLNQIKNCKL